MRGGVIGHHADDEIGVADGVGGRGCGAGPFGGQGLGFFRIAIEDAQWKASGEEAARHTHAHDSEAEEGDARFAHKGVILLRPLQSSQQGIKARRAGRR
jgi:hypothetical protein